MNRQLRNLVICPDESDPQTVYTIHNRSIVQHRFAFSLSSHSHTQRQQQQSGHAVQEIAKLPFDPVCLPLAPVHSPSDSTPNTWLLASGGQNAELHLSLHSPTFDKRTWE